MAENPLEQQFRFEPLVTSLKASFIIMWRNEFGRAERALAGRDEPVVEERDQPFGEID